MPCGYGLYFEWENVPVASDVARRDAGRSICIRQDHWRNSQVSPEPDQPGMNLGKVGPDLDRVQSYDAERIRVTTAREEDRREEGAATEPHS